MNRKNSPAAPKRPAVLIEALEPRIAPAALLESKFTSVAVGGTLLLDASGKPGTFQGLTTGSGGGSGSYLLYITSGRALVFTTDLNGNGRLDPGEITGISLGKDSLNHDPALILFSDVNGDIVTNLDGTSGSNLTDSDHNPNNGRDGQLLTDTNIASITLRTITSADIDSTIPGNTPANRLALTSFSVHGNIVAGGNIGAVTIDTSGTTHAVDKVRRDHGRPAVHRGHSDHRRHLHRHGGEQPVFPLHAVQSHRAAGRGNDPGLPSPCRGTRRRHHERHGGRPGHDFQHWHPRHR